MRRETNGTMCFFVSGFRRILAAAAVGAIVGGCGPNGWRLWRPSAAPPEAAAPALVDGQPMIAESDRPSEFAAAAGPVTLQITFEVLRVDVPVLGMRHALKVWNHVDETQSDPRLTALLARNGLRVGTASADAWPALRVLFDTNQAKSLLAKHVVQSGSPLSMRLGEMAEGEVVFSYRRDGRLVGQTFPGGTKFLHIDYALDPEDPTRTLIKATPEVRRFSEEKHWQTIDGRVQDVPRYEGRVFEDLSAELAVAPGQFLVIGPSESAANRSLIGGQFLTTDENNVTYETVICVTPHAVRVEAAGG